MTVAKSLPHLLQKVRKLLIPKLFLSYSCIFGKKTVIKYTANIYQEDSQTYPSRKQDTSELFFLGTGICTGERNSVYIQICILKW